MLKVGLFLLVGVWKAVILGAMSTMMTWFKRFWKRRISVSGLKIVLVIFCQRMWFLSALVEKKYA